MVLFASDLHFGHRNIVSLCNRPFADVDEMDAALIENWNRKVQRNDVVYLLGDVIWDKKKVGFYLDQLSGKKILIAGNHDSTWVKREACQGYFELILPYLETRLNGHPVTMCHYPMLEWASCREETKRKLGYLIHGHIHNRVSEEYRSLFLRFHALNAGVDINGFEPVSFEELVENNLRYKLSALSAEEDRERLLADYNRQD
ncbi:MAG: hydrolase [Ruminococcaceae bacterium]|nr:hydrolase [Oscillospiraceae bacterium]